MNTPTDFQNKGMKKFESLPKRPSLPTFNELPNFDLYMDQVIALINKYLTFFKDDDSSEIITHSMINNYVKLKIIPIPVKKKYSRIHLACLIMIGALKQSLSIPIIEFLLPNNCSEEECAIIYDRFVESWDNSFDMAYEMIKSQIFELFENEKYDEIYDLATDMAVGSNVFKVFTEKMISLHPDANKASEADNESKEKKDKKDKKEKKEKKDKKDKKESKNNDE